MRGSGNPDKKKQVESCSSCQGCGDGAQAILDAWNRRIRSPKLSDGGAEPEPEIWVPDPQPQFAGQRSCTNNIMFFRFQWTK